jgi:hypothetical protein
LPAQPEHLNRSQVNPDREETHLCHRPQPPWVILLRVGDRRAVKAGLDVDKSIGAPDVYPISWRDLARLQQLQGLGQVGCVTPMKRGITAQL